MSGQQGKDAEFPGFLNTETCALHALLNCVPLLRGSSSSVTPPSLKNAMTFINTVFSHTSERTPSTPACGEPEYVSVGQVFPFTTLGVG